MVKIGNPNDLIVTEEVAQELTPKDWSIEALEPTELRGIEEPVSTFHVVPVSTSS
jgi:class 3 adenylate cyclase